MYTQGLWAIGLVHTLQQLFSETIQSLNFYFWKYLYLQDDLCQGMSAPNILECRLELPQFSWNGVALATEASSQSNTYLIKD